MTHTPQAVNSGAEVHAVEEMLRTLGKTQRALQMYLPNNPVYQRAVQQMAESFVPVWAATDRLVLDIHDDRITWDESVVLVQPARSEGLAWQLYKDGLRRLVLVPGVEEVEIVRLLRVIGQARLLSAETTDDLLTLLWEQEFHCVSYTFIEALGEGSEFLQERGMDDGPRGSGGSGVGDARGEVDAARSVTDQGGDGNRGIVDLADFDATPYFLDETEVRFLHDELLEEYQRDIRESAIDALLDILETQQSTTIRQEVIALLENILPAQLSVGGFRVVARILRELRLIASRAEGLDDALRAAVLSFEERLSTPEILDQLLRVLGDTTVRDSDEDVGEVLRELKGSALPAVLRQLSKTTEPAVRRILETSVESLARTQPQLLGNLISGTDDDVVIPAISTAARLGLGQLAPDIVNCLTSPDDSVRIVAVRALGELATPTAVTAVESALSDPDRGVRQAALTLLMARGGSGGLRSRLETMLFDSDEAEFERSERRALFEAYGTIAGPAAIGRLGELVEPRGVFRKKISAEVRASALYALAKVGGMDARALVERRAADKDPVVRAAANSVLREWAQ